MRRGTGPPPTPRPSPQFPQLQGEEWPDPRLPWRSSAHTDCCKRARPVSGRNEGRGTEFLPGPDSRPGPASASCRWGHPAWSPLRTDAKAPTSFWTRQRGAVRVAAPRRVRPARTPLPQARVSRRAGPTQTRLAPARGFLSRPVRTRTRPDPDGRVPAAQETDQNNKPHIFRSLFEDLGVGGVSITY